MAKAPLLVATLVGGMANRGDCADLAAEVIAIRLPGSLVHLQMATAVRLAEPVFPHRRHSAPCRATPQARCLGNRRSRRPPATTNRKPWASWPFVTVKRPLHMAPPPLWTRRILSVEPTTPRRNQNLMLRCHHVCPLTDLSALFRDPARRNADGMRQLSTRSPGLLLEPHSDLSVRPASLNCALASGSIAALPHCGSARLRPPKTSFILVRAEPRGATLTTPKARIPRHSNPPSQCPRHQLPARIFCSRPCLEQSTTGCCRILSLFR